MTFSAAPNIDNVRIIAKVLLPEVDRRHINRQTILGSPKEYVRGF